MKPLSLSRFQRAAGQYVAAKGWDGADAEDLVQWMLVEALGQPTRWLAIAWCYAHALDRLNPRHRTTGQPWRLRSRTYPIVDEVPRSDKVRDDEIVGAIRHAGANLAVCLSGASSATARVEGLQRFRANPAAPDPLPDVLWWAQVARALAACAPDPRTRRMFRRYVWEDWRLHEIATAEGVTESRVCQILGTVRAALRVHLAQEDTR